MCWQVISSVGGTKTEIYPQYAHVAQAITTSWAPHEMNTTQLHDVAVCTSFGLREPHFFGGSPSAFSALVPSTTIQNRRHTLSRNTFLGPAYLPSLRVHSPPNNGGVSVICVSSSQTSRSAPTTSQAPRVTLCKMHRSRGVVLSVSPRFSVFMPHKLLSSAFSTTDCVVIAAAPTI